MESTDRFAGPDMIEVPKSDGGKRMAKESKLEGFSEEEKSAMKARIKEMKAEARLSANRAEGEQALLAAIAAMPEPGREMSKRLHAIITANAPALAPKTWYGMPAYANADGKVVLFFRGAEKFKERYMTFGFNQEARLDKGTFWPIAYALTELNAAVESEIAALVKKAVA